MRGSVNYIHTCWYTFVQKEERERRCDRKKRINHLTYLIMIYFKMWWRRKIFYKSWREEEGLEEGNDTAKRGEKKSWKWRVVYRGGGGPVRKEQRKLQGKATKDYRLRNAREERLGKLLGDTVRWGKRARNLWKDKKWKRLRKRKGKWKEKIWREGRNTLKG